MLTLFLSGPSSSSQLPSKPFSSIPCKLSSFVPLFGMWSLIFFFLANGYLLLETQLKYHPCCEHVANSSEQKLFLLSLCMYAGSFPYYCLAGYIYPPYILSLKDGAHLFISAFLCTSFGVWYTNKHKCLLNKWIKNRYGLFSSWWAI